MNSQLQYSQAELAVFSLFFKRSILLENPEKRLLVFEFYPLNDQPDVFLNLQSNISFNGRSDIFFKCPVEHFLMTDRTFFYV